MKKFVTFECIYTGNSYQDTEHEEVSAKEFGEFIKKNKWYIDDYNYFCIDVDKYGTRQLCYGVDVV